MKPISIIILNWNGAAMMRRFLPSVIRHSQPLGEVIVADNASTDDSLRMLADEFPEVRTIVLDRNYGFAEGYNRAIDQVDTPYTLLLNSDVEVTPDYLTPLYDYMEANTDVAAVQPKLRAEWRRTHFEYAGAAGGFIDWLGYPFCRGRIFDKVEEDKGQYDTPCDVFWTTGAAMLVRTHVYKEVGGLDCRFFAHMEEIDLCWRLNNLGWRLACIPQSVVYHVGGGTLPQGNPRKTFLNFRNNLLMIHKNHPQARRILRYRWWLDALASVVFLLKGQFKDTSAVWKAHREFKKMCLTDYIYMPMKSITSATKSITSATKSITSPTKFISSAGKYPNVPTFPSILWAFYIKRQHTFSSLTIPFNSKQ